MVHGLFRASGIVMFYGLHHDFRRRKVGVSSECLGHFWRAEVGHFWKAPKGPCALTIGSDRCDEKYRA